MNGERTGGIPKGTIVDRGGYIGPQGRINTELVRPPISPTASPSVQAETTQREASTVTTGSASTENA